MAIRSALLAATLCLIAAPAMAQTRSHDLCYEFPRAFFKAATDSTKIIRLLNAHNAPRGSVDAIGLQPDEREQHRRAHFSSWSYLVDDSISIVWHNGFYGPVFKGAQHGDTIEGYVRHTTDHGREPPLERTRALRVPCPPFFTNLSDFSIT